MASASILSPPPTSNAMAATSSAEIHNERSSDLAAPAESQNLASVPLPLPPQPPSSNSPSFQHSPSNASKSPANDDFASPSSLSSVDVDAEGSPDDDFNMGDPMEVDHPSPISGTTSSDQSIRRAKRKFTLEDDEYIRNDPELYGLRRSGRATQAQRVIESHSDDDSYDSDVGPRRVLKRRKQNASSRKVSNNPSPAPRVSAPSDDSDSDVYGGARAKALAKKNRQRQKLGTGTSTPLGEVRFSTRRAAKITTYNEDDSQDEFAEDTDLMTSNYGAAEVEDNSPAIDAVLKHRLPDDLVPKKPHKEDYEYYVKWQGQSHHHATWKPYSELASLRGAKKVKNYFDHIVREDHRIRNDPNVQPDEKEQWIIAREEKADEIADFTKVERVIDVRQGEHETEYLIKWKGLYYDSCTWEATSLVSTLAQHEIDRYLNRASTTLISDKQQSNPNTRSPYKPFKEQPSYVRNGELREFQIRGVNFLAHNWCRGTSVILADEMGLGKTVQTVAFLSWLRHERQQHGPFLVVVPLSTLPSWADTFDYWAPDTNYVVYNGGEAARSLIREKELFVDGNPRKTRFNVLLTTYEYITKKEAWTSQLSQVKWQFLAVDEAHRLKNRDSQLYEKLMDLGAPASLLITGTPIQNNLGELAALMNFIMPNELVVDENIDLSDEAASRRITELNDTIAPYFLRRTKQKVESDLPPKTEKIIRVELSDIQLEYYKNILTRNYAALNQGGHGYKQSLLNIMMELKKCSNHPFMFPSAEERLIAGNARTDDILKALITSSGKMMLLDQLITKLKKDNHRVLIFSQMVKMLDIMSDYMRLRGYQFQRLDGTIPSGVRKLAMDHFNAPESKDFAFLLSTRAGGLGINLMTADTVILFDSDWNPQADLQAMARAHRIGQKNPVTVYRFVSKDTIEEEILERARNKLMLEFITIQRGVTDKDPPNSINRRIAEAKRGLEGSPNDPDDINRILKRRGQKMFEQSGNQKRLEELDIDAVLENAEEHQTEQPERLAADGGEEFLKSFEYTDVKVDLEWDDIIPKEQLEEIKAEEKKKEEERYLAQVIEENAPRKRKAPGEAQNQREAKRRSREIKTQADSSDDEDDDHDDSDSDSKANLDPKRPLSEKEIRNLIRAYEAIGYLEDRPDEIARKARLVGRDTDVLRSTLNEVQEISRRLLKEDQDRLDAIQRSEGKLPTKKDRKAVTFDFHGVKRINAETIVERGEDMCMLREAVAKVTDFRTFRVPGAQKPPDYTVDWGAREDGMLCIGVARHGHGSWQEIENDPDLGLANKMFLAENQVARKEERSKSEDPNRRKGRKPGAVHLVRRINYLFLLLRATVWTGSKQENAQKTLDNHHRNTKKASASAVRRPDKSGQNSSPAPGGGSSHRASRDGDRSRPHSSGSHLRPNDRPSSERHTSEGRDPDRNKFRGSHSPLHPPQHKSHRSSGGSKDLERSKSSHQHGSLHGPTANGDRRLDGDHRHRNSPLSNGAKLNGAREHKPPRPESQLSPAEAQKQKEMREFFRPIREVIESMRKAKRGEGKDDVERTKIVKTALRSIGDHIMQGTAKRSSNFEFEVWDFFAKHYWFNNKIPASKIRDQYNRIVRASLDATASSAEASKTGTMPSSNGTSKNTSNNETTTT